MTDTAEVTTEQAVEAIYRFAAAQLQAGVAPATVRSNLVDKGLSEEAAGIVVGNLQQALTKAHQEAGQKDMLYGALWCIGGIAVTVGTYSAASGGGTYVIAWGAIVFGAIQFFRGLARSAGE
jgi:hypothetical protein